MIYVVPKAPNLHHHTHPLLRVQFFCKILGFHLIWHDSINRLISASDTGFTYDAFGRCQTIRDASFGTKTFSKVRRPMGSVMVVARTFWPFSLI